MSRAARAAAGILAAALVLVVAPAAPAQGPASGEFDVRAYVAPERPTVTEPFRFVIEVGGGGIPNVGSPSLPRFENLRVLRGPQTSTQQTIVNGRITASVKLIWVVMPEGPGPARIPPVEVPVGGTLHTTDAIELEIAEAGAAPPGAGAAPGPGGTPGSAAAEEPVFLQARLGDDDVWVGEPVLLEVTLFSALPVQNVGWDARPGFDAFWTEAEDIDLEAEQYRTEIDGRPYFAYPLERQILIPTAAGTFEIEPYAAQIRVRSRSRSAFDFFDFGRSATVLRSTTPLSMRVRQLPRAGQPAEFSGAVGSFSVEASYDRESAAVDDAVALRVRVAGEGSLRSVRAPAIPAPVDLDVFDPQSEESSFRRAGRAFRSARAWEWIVVPVAPGTYRLPAVEFHYFDPQAGAYRTAIAELPPLSVERGEGRPDRAPPPTSLDAVRRELRYLKLDDGRLRRGEPLAHETVAFRIAAAAPFVLGPLLILWGRQRAHRMRDRGQVRARRARTRARKAFRATRRRMADVESAEFHEEVARALVEYVADRLDRSGAGLTYDAADDLLAARGVDADLRRRFRATLERCDFARFVPSAAQPERRVEVLDEAAAVVEELERRWR